MRVARASAPITTLCCVRRIGQYFEPIYGRPSAVSVGELNVTKVLNEVMAANARYADEFGDKAKLPMPPGRRFAILTCMDARLDPAKFAGLAEGDAHVIRNAGGRASDDAIRSLVISHKLLGTREWFVIHHTDCGMETFTDEIMRGLLASSLETASIDRHGWRDTGKGPGSSEARYIDWLTIDDNARSVVEDVARIRNHPLVNKSIPVHGYIYDVKSGRLMEVAEASEVGGVPSSEPQRSTKTAKTGSAKAQASGKAMKAGSIKAQKAGKATKSATRARKSGKTRAV
jgi:carbonic anhydrase